jgi:predicted PurR-regulated permease PerM
MPQSQQIRTLALAAATALALYLCWLVARPFVSVITWALGLAIVAHPWHRWLERRMRPTLASLLSVVSVALVLVIPAVAIGQKLFREVNAGLEVLGPQLTPDRIYAKLQDFPWLAAAVEKLDATLNLNQEIGRAAGALTARISALVGSSIWLVTQLFLTFVTLFFFFRDRTRLLDSLRALIPLSTQDTTRVLDRISSTISTCLYGNVIVKSAQGLLGGLMFWMLGLPAPVFFGAAMALLAALPILGTALVWGPAAIWLAVQGSWGKALILALWGIFVVGLIDNILYPILVAGELRLHTLAVFFSILGGLIAFGFAGVILGPVILAVTEALLDVWKSRKSSEEPGSWRSMDSPIE